MIRSVIAVIWSAWWCGLALVSLILVPTCADFVLLKLAKKYWSIPLLRFIVGAKLIVDIEAEANKLLMSGKGAVLMANHSSYLDINAAFAATPSPIVFLAKSSVRKIPLLGGANARVGTVFVERGNKESANLAISTLVNTINKGRCVLVFPEGTRSNDREVRSFKKGGFHLATKANASIIPVYISGTSKFLPKGSSLIKRNSDPIIVRFGKPIHSNDVVELKNLTHEAIIALSRKSISED